MSFLSYRTSVEPTYAHTRVIDQKDNIIDIREYDVPYHVRVAIDMKINVGHWYYVRGRGSEPPEIRLVSDDDQPDRPVSTGRRVEGIFVSAGNIQSLTSDPFIAQYGMAIVCFCCLHT